MRRPAAVARTIAALALAALSTRCGGGEHPSGGGPAGSGSSAAPSNAGGETSGATSTGAASARTAPATAQAADGGTEEQATCGGASCSEAPAGHPLQEEQVRADGTDVLAARITSEVDAPFEVMAAILNDFEQYKTFLPQVSDSRVVQRRRGEVDVYLNIVLLRGLGNLWSVSTFQTHRAPDMVVMDGRVTQGNMRRFDSRLEVTPVPGTRRTRLVVQLLGVPSFPFPDSVLTNQQPYWTRLTFLALRARAERMAAGEIPVPRTYAASSPTGSATAPPTASSSTGDAGVASTRGDAGAP